MTRTRTSLYVDAWLGSLWNSMDEQAWDRVAKKYGITPSEAERAFAEEEKIQNEVLSEIESLGNSDQFVRLVDPKADQVEVMGFYGPNDGCVTTETVPSHFREELGRTLCGGSAVYEALNNSDEVVGRDMLPTDLLHMIKNEGWVPMDPEPMFEAYLTSHRDEVASIIKTDSIENPSVTNKDVHRLIDAGLLSERGLTSDDIALIASTAAENLARSGLQDEIRKKVDDAILESYTTLREARSMDEAAR